MKKKISKLGVKYEETLRMQNTKMKENMKEVKGNKRSRRLHIYNFRRKAGWRRQNLKTWLENFLGLIKRHKFLGFKTPSKKCTKQLKKPLQLSTSQWNWRTPKTLLRATRKERQEQQSDRKQLSLINKRGQKKI